jgi:putative FmdB family regulatory protein
VPIYEYSCQECHTEFEQFVRAIGTQTSVRCPECGGTDVKKAWSRFGLGRSGSNEPRLSASSAPGCTPAGT